MGFNRTPMLKLITLAACVIGFFFLGPKALAEFRQARLTSQAQVSPPDLKAPSIATFLKV